jgi:hypothetical protein
MHAGGRYGSRGVSTISSRGGRTFSWSGGGDGDGNLGKGVKGRGRGSKACPLVANGERGGSVDRRGGARKRGLGACWEYKTPRGYPCARGVAGSGRERVFLVAVDGTGKVFLGVLGEVFNTEVTREGESRGRGDMCTRREPSTSVVVSNAGAAKVGKERGHLVIPWSAMIRLSKCEELTTVKPVT